MASVCYRSIPRGLVSSVVPSSGLPKSQGLSRAPILDVLLLGKVDHVQDATAIFMSGRGGVAALKLLVGGDPALFGVGLADFAGFLIGGPPVFMQADVGPLEAAGGVDGLGMVAAVEGLPVAADGVIRGGLVR